MQGFFEALMNPGSWTQTQWLALGIALFLLLASVYFVVKLFQIFREATGKSTYKPNIGMSRIRAEQEARQQASGDTDRDEIRSE